MAIDEKKLIEAIYELNASKPNAPLEFVVTLGMVLTLIENQPKISLETKTSDNDVPDNNVEKMNREFEELEVTYTPDDLCTYPEYRGKPYFAIKYKENGNHFVGYGTYKPEVLSRYLRDYFMPLAMPKESKWIPVTEMLPKQNERIIGTFYNDENCRAFVGEATYFPDILDTPYPLIAWMPLPEAYKGE